MLNIEYKDISLTASNDSTVSCTKKEAFSNLELLKQLGVAFKKFATLEDYLWKLDGSFENFPVSPESENFGLWSKELSDANGAFTTPIDLQISFSNYESCVGITFNFSTLTDDYPTEISIKWYQNDTLLSEKDFISDKSQFFCENSVTNFNKLIITFLKMSKPYRRLKIEQLVYGVVRNFGDDELRNLSVLEDVSLTSEELKVNTLEFTLSNKSLIDFIFLKKQPLTLTRNGELIGTFFIDTSKRKSKTLYDISAVDYIGVMDKIPFAGGTYTNVVASELIASIMGDIPYELDENLAIKTLSGTLEACTKREALLQVAFAICAVVDTARSSKIKIFKRSTIKKETISQGIYTGGSFSVDGEITEIRVTQSDGLTVSKRNPILAVDALDNVLEFSGVFINASNSQEILDSLYEYYVANKNSKTDMKFIVENGERCGDVIEYVTEYLGTKKGQITQMKFSFNSLKFVARAQIKDLED